MKKVIPPRAVLIPDTAACVFKGVIYDVYQWQQKQFDGSYKTFEMLRRPDTAVIIAVVDDKIIVLEDEQPHAGTSVTFPAGRIDQPGETTLQAAQREAREETGYSFAEWRLLDVKQPFVKNESFVYTYLAQRVLDKTYQELDAGERISIKLLPFAEVRKKILDKVGYLREARDLFEPLASLEDLRAAPAYAGREIDR